MAVSDGGPSRDRIRDRRERWPQRILVTGKGGVGKSTIAAALALVAARDGAQPLLMEAGARASLARIVGATPTDVPAPLFEGVYGVSLAGDAALVAFAADVLHSRRLARVLVGHRAIGTLMAAMPAVAEVAAMHVLDRRRDYAPVVVDLEATGHAQMWLELRDTLSPVMSRGGIADMLARMHDELADPGRTALVLVTRAEPLAVAETTELCESLQQPGSVRPRAIIVAGTTPTGPALADIARLRAVADARGAAAVRDDLDYLAREAQRAAHEREMAAPLHGTGVPVLWSPRVASEGRAALFAIGEPLAAALLDHDGVVTSTGGDR